MVWLLNKCNKTNQSSDIYSWKKLETEKDFLNLVWISLNLRQILFRVKHWVSQFRNTRKQYESSDDFCYSWVCLSKAKLSHNKGNEEYADVWKKETVLLLHTDEMHTQDNL